MPDRTTEFNDEKHESLLKQRQLYFNTILKTLHEVSLLISADPSPAKFLGALPSVLIRPNGFKMAWIMLFGADKSVQFSSFSGETGYPDILEPFVSKRNIPVFLAPVIGKSGSQLIDPFPASNPQDAGQILAGYAYPLIIKKQTVGILVVAFDQLYVVDEQHRQFFDEIALRVIQALIHDQIILRLRESEEKFRVLFERSADAQLIMKGDVFIECNDAMVNILGAHSKNELIGLTPWEVSPENQSDGSDTQKKGLGLIQAAEDGSSIRSDWMLIRFDGAEVPVEASFTPVNYGSESFVHVAMRDISARTKAEKELMAANNLFRLIMANTPDIIWIRDMELNLTYINQAVERLKGFSPEEVMRQPPDDTSVRPSIRMFTEILREELNTEADKDTDASGVHRFESDEDCRDGSTIHTETLATFIRGEDYQPTGILGITRDISEQQRLFVDLEKAKKRAEESDRLKSAFLANMSYEIRTPMNSILGFTELLGEEHLSLAERKQYTGIIQSSANQLLIIISDIIGISKIQAGQMDLHPELINLNKLFEEMQANFRLDLAKYHKSHIELKRSCICQGLADRVLVDTTRLNQIMGNLISNAIKFTQAGSIEFGCTSVQNPIRFYVKDTGKGIAPAHQNIIFERFRQVEESVTRTFTGAGLGLSICKGLVTLMGGEIGVISEPGKGSEFWFTVPVSR